MATIIDNTFFYGELLVPQITEASVVAKLQRFIDSYEREYLERVLGYELAKNLLAGLAAPGPDAKWTKLRDGDEFENRLGVLVKWNGLKRTLGTHKLSPIANYVFFMYARAEASAFTGTGEAVIEGQNSKRVDNLGKLSKVWNQMVEENRMLYEYLYQNQEVYPEAFRNGFGILQSAEMFRSLNAMGI